MGRPEITIASFVRDPAGRADKRRESAVVTRSSSRPRRNQAAFERTVRALKAGGKLEAVDAAHVAAGRTLARLLDDHDEPVVTVVWPYLNVLRELRGVTGGGTDDDLAGLIAALSGPVGDRAES